VDLSASGRSPLHIDCSSAKKRPCVSIIDSGTTLLSFPTEVHENLLAEINQGCKDGRSGCLEQVEKSATCSGEHFDQLPDLHFTLGGQNLTMSPTQYMAPMEVAATRSSAYKNGEPKLGLDVRQTPVSLSSDAPVDGTATVNACVPLFASMDEQTDYGSMIIMGMPFLRAYAVNFDRANAKMLASPVPVGSTLCAECPGPRAKTKQLDHHEHRADQNDDAEDAAFAVSHGTDEAESTEDTTLDKVRKANGTGIGLPFDHKRPMRMSEIRRPTLFGWERSAHETSRRRRNPQFII